jgi:hypothetical protein
LNESIRLYSFDLSDKDKEVVTRFLKASSSLSRIINSLIPENIEGEFSTVDALTAQIIDDKNAKFKNCKAMMEAPDIIQTGIIKAIGFLIIKKHKEAEKYPRLMEIREVINENQAVMSLAARGSKKGNHGDELMDAMEKNLSSRNVVMVKTDTFRSMAEIVCDKAFIENDPKAFNVIRALYIENKKALLALPVNNN